MIGYDLTARVDAETFADWLVKGFGRTILYARSHDTKPLRDTIANAVVHDVRFDRQLDTDRGEYLNDLLVATGERDYYRNLLIDLLPGLDSDKSDPWQVVSVLRRFAQSGDVESADAVLHRFQTDATNGLLDSLDEVLLLEGPSGLLRAANLISLDAIPEDNRWFIGSCIEDLVERDGRDVVRSSIARLARENPALAPWYAWLQDYWKRIQEIRTPGPRREKQTYEQIVELLEQSVGLPHKKVRSNLTSAGSLAFPEAITKIADDFRCELDPVRAGYFIHIFERREYQGDPRPLLRLIDSPDEVVSRSAFNALERVRHPSLRPVALQLASEPGKEWQAAALLTRNLESNDVGLLEDLLNRPIELNEIHVLGIRVRDAAVNHPDIDCSRPMVTLYELGPCSMCRCGYVDYLAGRQDIPVWMSDEVPFDCYSQTRSKALQSQ